MTEIESVISCVCSALENTQAAEVLTAFPQGGKKRYTTPVIAVGLRCGESASAGFAEYLGERHDVNSGAYCEIYGKRLELTLGVDIYSPKESGAGACLQTAAKVMAALPDLPNGVRVKKFSCGETVFDPAAGMFLLRAEMPCTCFMYADKTGDEELLDFTLRGVLKN